MSYPHNPHDPQRQAVVSMPSSAQMGGAQPLPFVRFPFFPTSPWYSTNPDVGYQVRFYSTGIQFSDTDFAVGAEAVRSVQFDLPVRLIAINGAASNNVGLGVGGTPITTENMNLLYLLRVEYSMGDKLHTTARLAETVVGRGSFPGEIGGHGYNIDQGASLQVGITPLQATVGVLEPRIDITFVCLELRAPRNFNVR